jgi:hypothetical protein
MKKKLNKNEMREFIARMIYKDKRKLNENFSVAQSEMELTENNLAQTFNKKQRVLYDDFCKKRELFYNAASELYEKIF